MRFPVSLDVWVIDDNESILESLRAAFARAGWVGMTAQQARRQVALSLDRQGADRAQLRELLGLRSARQVRRLLRLPPMPLDLVSHEIV